MEHPIRSSRGVDIKTPQAAVLKHLIFNSVAILGQIGPNHSILDTSINSRSSVLATETEFVK